MHVEIGDQILCPQVRAELKEHMSFFENVFNYACSMSCVTPDVRNVPLYLL